MRHCKVCTNTITASRAIYCSAPCRQRAYRRRKDPLVGSVERKRVQADALYEHRITLDVRADLRRSDLLGSSHPEDRRESGYGSTSTSASFGSQPPSFVSNPSYAAFAEARQLFHGLEVRGWTAEPGETKYVTRKLRVSVSNKVDLQRESERHATDTTLQPDGWLWTKPSIVNGNRYSNAAATLTIGGPLSQNTIEAIAGVVAGRVKDEIAQMREEMRSEFYELHRVFRAQFPTDADYEQAVEDLLASVQAEIGSSRLAAEQVARPA